MKKKNSKKKKEFSKILLIQESILIWIITIVFLILTFYCIYLNFLGSLPWLTAMISLPWGAYAVSQACYYGKSKAENTEKGIKYETALRALSESAEDPVLDKYYSDMDDYQI